MPASRCSAAADSAGRPSLHRTLRHAIPGARYAHDQLVGIQALEL